MTTSELFAVVASTVAIVTSAGSLGVAIAVARSDRPHLKVSASLGFRYQSGDRLDEGDVRVMIDIRNDGRYPEVVQAVGFTARASRRIQLDGSEPFHPERQPPGASMPAKACTSA